MEILKYFQIYWSYYLKILYRTYLSLNALEFVWRQHFPISGASAALIRAIHDKRSPIICSGRRYPQVFAIRTIGEYSTFYLHNMMIICWMLKETGTSIALVVLAASELVSFIRQSGILLVTFCFMFFRFRIVFTPIKVTHPFLSCTIYQIGFAKQIVYKMQC